MPAASAAAITSASRTEPPGWATARTPASMSTCRPSGNGKNASDAATEPAARSPARATARRAESTRFTWPIPTPTVAPPAASRIALDLTDRTARQANTRSARSAPSRAAPQASRHAAGSSPGASTPSRICTSTPPETGRHSAGSGRNAGARSSRMFFFAASTSTAPST